TNQHLDRHLDSGQDMRFVGVLYAELTQADAARKSPLSFYPEHYAEALLPAAVDAEMHEWGTGALTRTHIDRHFMVYWRQAQQISRHRPRILRLDIGIAWPWHYRQGLPAVL